MKKRYQQNMVIKAVVTTIFCAISFVVLYPLVYVVSAAFSPGVGIASVNIIPFADGFTIEHFVKLFTESDYGKWFRNTLVIALSTSVITVFVASLGAYVFSRFRFVIKKPMLMSYTSCKSFRRSSAWSPSMSYCASGARYLWGWCLCTSREYSL